MMPINKKNSQLIFCNLTLAHLRHYFTIHKVHPKNEFKQWAAFDYTWKEGEQQFLQKLIQEHSLAFRFYNEMTLQMKFLGPLYHQVHFQMKVFQDFYHEYVKADFGEIVLAGYPDMMLAKGDLIPELPYFFIQEFKPSKPDKDPEIQVLGAMIAALQLNQTNELWGGYITGTTWNFMIVRQLEKKQYEYTVSKNLDSLDERDLQQIFVMLQAVKQKCKEYFLNK